MDKQQKALELKVGFFVFVGLAFIAVMVVQFGSIGQSFKKFYDLTIEFPNASGLIKGSDVQLAGARIGYVTDKPAIASNVGNVVVHLKISQEVKIPRKTLFVIDSAGLLGDRFVDVAPAADFDPARFNPSDPAQILQPGETIKGGELPGFKQLMQEGKPLLEELRGAVSEVHQIAASIRTGLLNDANQKNLSDTFANLKTTSENFAQASKGFDEVIKSAQGTVGTASTTMTSVNAAATDIRMAVADARKVLEAARTVVQQASGGDGLFATLLSDPQVAQNLKALIINLRERGVLFYKDVSSQPKPAEPKRR